MYRAVELTSCDKDLHLIVWRSKPSEKLRDYRMTCVTFGMSPSSFAANMAVKQNSPDLATKCPQTKTIVEKSFYVDDGLTGADSIEEARDLLKQLQDLFSSGGFLLRKWNSNHPAVLQQLPSEFQDDHSTQALHSSEEYTKTLRIEWSTTRITSDSPFQIYLPLMSSLIKRVLVSDVAKTFDVLEFQSLETSHGLPRSSCLLSLCPILDQSGLLRVGGRLDNTQMWFSIRHPAILASTRLPS